MKAQSISHKRKGFTLMELMVAMAITVIIVTVLVSITSIAIDTWNRSRSELRAARQAKSMVDTMARDFEAIVTRAGGKDADGKPFQWFVADSGQSGSAATGPLPSTNATNLIFFTAATDRYNGEIGKQGVDMGGDVSCVGYELFWKDPIDRSGGSVFETFVLNRKLVNPDETFQKLLGKSGLAAEFDKISDVDNPLNFVCENLYQLTISFHLTVPSTTPGGPPVPRVVTIGPSGTVKKMIINGDGIDADGDTTLKNARLTAVQISLTVLSDTGVDQLRKRSFTGNQQSEFMAKHSYQYSKLVQVPGM